MTKPDIKTTQNNKHCVYCAASETVIKTEGLQCEGVDRRGRVVWSRARHRYKPFSEQEQSVIKQAEQAGY